MGLHKRTIPQVLVTKIVGPPFRTITKPDWYYCSGEIIDLLRDGDIYQYQGRVSMRPPANWREKAKSNGVVERGHPRVLLVGDAIHAMLPNRYFTKHSVTQPHSGYSSTATNQYDEYRGMGGNQAMRDTSVLLPILVKLAKKCHSTGKGLVLADLNAACKEYEDEMIPRGFGWVRKSGGDTLMVRYCCNGLSIASVADSRADCRF